MIRINLLPIKHDRKKEATRNQLALGILVIIVELVIGIFIYMNMDSKVQEQKNLNGSLERQIAQIESEIAEHNKIIADIAEFEKRQAAIDGLVAARTGPVFVMLEISRILSRNGRPTINNDAYQALIKENPVRGYDEDWDYRRIWIKSFKEKDRNITILGQGITHEDVAEFLRRLSLSDFFVSSELVSTSLSKPDVAITGVNLKAVDQVVSFSVIGSVKYK